MNRKMCDRFREPKTKLQRMFCHEFMGIKCPSDTNSKCEIIPKKPKTKTFKAWADVSKEGKLFGAFPDMFMFEGTKKSYKPCTITISTKYLKGK